MRHTRTFAGVVVAALLAGVPAGTAELETAALETATFAAGCFWCTEADFDHMEGVRETISGYTGGRFANPTYEQVSSGGTGHVEAVEVRFDPAVVTYEQLLEHFWRNVDPFDGRGQFCDIGEQYRPVIFYRTEAQRTAAQASKERVEKLLRKRVAVQVAPAGLFYRAEEYHQNYHRKNRVRYNYYRWSCGRDRRLKDVWGKVGTTP